MGHPVPAKLDVDGALHEEEQNMPIKNGCVHVVCTWVCMHERHVHVLLPEG